MAIEFKLLFYEYLDKGKIMDEKDFLQSIKECSEQKQKNALNWYQQMTQFTYLPTFLDGLEEVYIHSAESLIYQFNNYQLEFSTELTLKDLTRSLEIMALQQNQDWNYAKPFVSFNSKIYTKEVRITLTHHSLSPNLQPSAFIRILNSKALNLTRFITEDQIPFYEKIIRQKKNILIAGPTGSGKTTLMNSLLSKIPPEEHLIMLEDTEELISPHKRTTRLISNINYPNRSLNNYLSYAMRMSPDRIVIGEMRSKEVESTILALNTGHNGLLSSIHANSAKEAIDRMALLFKVHSDNDLSYELILKLIAKNIDYVVYVENKKIKELIEVFGSEQSTVFFDNVAA